MTDKFECLHPHDYSYGKVKLEAQSSNPNGDIKALD